LTTIARIGAGLLFLAGGSGLGIAQQDVGRSSLVALSRSIRELTRSVAPAVVEILVTGYGAGDEDRNPVSSQMSRQKSSGSGVIVDPTGFIVTNAHVVQGAVRVQVLIPAAAASDGPSDQIGRARTAEARVIGIDRESDLALIRVDETGLPVLAFGDSDKLRQGDLVFAVGSPMGLRNSVSMGVVSATARAASQDNPILYIQTDASINPGDSGGALVDSTGLLVGVNSYIVSRSGGSEGIGFAIPGNIVANVYEQLRRKGRVSRGHAGLFVQDLNPVLAKGLDLWLQEGVLVADVEPGGPAEAAGLLRRDVILSVNGRAVATAREFENDIYRRKGGETISLVTQRGRDRRTVSLEIKEQSAPWDPLTELAEPQKNLVPRLGVLCIEIDKEVAKLMPDLRRSYGIIVVAKDPNGQAQFIDLQPGDIIHSVNNTPVAVLTFFQKTIEEFDRGSAVVLQVERDSKLQYVAFEIE
jgi:serine protease Do